ncbi:hypothetical protein CI610_03084 [invertebrate metagenome]|uniref:Uncharacterized protein n=1 Tax=invertebrate metagenome TaxID=1711999 RepID=A0A2H9T430_9ZZZZ
MIQNRKIQILLKRFIFIVCERKRYFKDVSNVRRSTDWLKKGSEEKSNRKQRENEENS